MNRVRRDREIGINELRRIGAVGVNAADLRRRDDRGVGSFRGVEGLDGGLVGEIEVAPRAEHERHARLPRKMSHERGAHHALVTGDVETHGVRK